MFVHARTIMLSVAAAADFPRSLWLAKSAGNLEGRESVCILERMLQGKLTFLTVVFREVASPLPLLRHRPAVKSLCARSLRYPPIVSDRIKRGRGIGAQSYRQYNCPSVLRPYITTRTTLVCRINVAYFGKPKVPYR